MPRYKKIEINVKEDTIARLIEGYLSGYAPSRKSVADERSVSFVTSSKVANALIDSGFMEERVFTKKGESPCAHLFCRENTSILIADMSSSIYKMTIMNSSGNVKFRAIYDYDTYVSCSENLNIFFSRYGNRAIRSGYGFSAIAVIYPDENAVTYLENQELNASLPLISSREYVSDTVFAIFKKRPAAHFTVSEAIIEAMKFKAHGDTVLTNGISYIFVGSHLSLFHIRPDGSSMICSPQNLLEESDSALLKKRFIEKADSDRILIRLADFMGAAFSPSTIIIESDSFLPDDETVEKISKKFALSRLRVPIICFKDNSCPLYEIGAVRSTLCTIMKRYVISK